MNRQHAFTDSGITGVSVGAVEREVAAADFGQAAACIGNEDRTRRIQDGGGASSWQAAAKRGTDVRVIPARRGYGNAADLVSSVAGAVIDHVSYGRRSRAIAA